MQATVRRWVEGRARDVESALTTSPIGLRPLSSQTLEKFSPELTHALSDVNGYLEQQDLLRRWPFPVGGRHLVLVLRQWVLEDPSETLANLMSSNADWLGAMTKFRERLNRSGGSLVDGHEESQEPLLTIRPDQSGTALDIATTIPSGNSDRLVIDISRTLEHCLLPVTPATIGFSLARIVGNDHVERLPPALQRLVLRRQSDGRPLPARGALLESHLYASLALANDDEGAEPERVGATWIVQPDAQLRISTDAAMVTGPFIKEALANAMLAHRQVAASLAQHPLADIRAIRKAQPGRKSPLENDEGTYSYIEEARHEAQSNREDLLALGAEWKRDAAIERLLTTVQKRVAQRRKRAGQLTTPPAGWRKAARSVIHKDLARKNPASR